MGGRYYVTGVQIGMILAFLELNMKEKVKEVLDKIQEEQSMGDYIE